MIEVKVNTVDETVECEMSIDGMGNDLIAEALTLIGTVTKNIRNTSEDMYAAMLHIMAHSPEILRGEMGENEEKAEVEMARAMSKGVLN